MPRAQSLAPLLCLSLLAPVAYADEPDTAPPDAASPAEPPPPSPEAVTKAWKVLVELGDAARARGQVDEAVKAYRRAYDLHPDPELAARVGLYLLQIDRPVSATALLIEALEGGAGKDAKDKERIMRGILAVRARVCLLHVAGNLQDAAVTVNGDPVSRKLGAFFRMFEVPGRLVIVGQSKEHGEARDVVNCPAGGEVYANLRWKLPEPAPNVEPAPKVEPAPAPAVVPVAPPVPLAATKAKAESALGVYVERYTKQEDPYGYEEQPAKPSDAEKKPMRGFVGVGPVVVFGAATWAPAVGASITGGLRLHEHVSVELEGRAAWLAGGVKGEAITTMTAGGVLGLCANWRYFLGCGLGHLGVIAVNWDETKYERGSDVFFSPGFGGRLGARLDLGSSWGLQVAGDVLGLSRGTRIVVGQTVLVEQPAVMISTSLALLRKF
ncbi:tetratricopeptide repeat protein [Polyangium fumosum]|uniref:Tetratricopeptide repeat protein n=1 Tax=Polyangium fumosum TaxID=889272 RepID=A0A4U1J778_9BACT|nr:tetratricopeptide repeat protein [Polyangium fumosum]TKD03205.1 tetratricopeptide repeat protein [Polyangium fumosum]